MKNFSLMLVVLVSMLGIALVGTGSATIIDFEDGALPNNGISSTGEIYYQYADGGHLYIDDPGGTSYLNFADPVHIESFQMHALPFSAYSGSGGTINVSAINSNGDS